MKKLACALLLCMPLLRAGAQTTGNTYRPLYHFTTDSNWINDPNGLLFYKGQYHVFSQYNPYGDKWGHMSWSHAVSSDLFHWKQQPLAIPEFKNADGSMSLIFSGSAVADSFNTSGFAKNSSQIPLVAIYTAHVDKAGTVLSQHQNLAYSLDDGQTWTAYTGNPVLDIQSTEFRDPSVCWYAPGKTWVMAVSKPDAYKIRFYSSPDLKQWKYLSEFGGIGNKDEVWECPDLVQVPVEGSTEKKWLLLVSGGNPVKGFRAMQYFTGNFNGQAFTADEAAYPLYVDNGKDFFAGISFNNVPAADGRTILLGWLNDWVYANEVPSVGFRGQYAVPRTLSLRKTLTGYRLLQQPVAELAQQAVQTKTITPFTVTSSSLPVYESASPALDISFKAALPYAAAAGIELWQDSLHTTRIAFNNTTQTISIDRRNAGLHGFSDRFASIDTVHVRENLENASFRILVDACSVEVFVNDGEYVLSDLIFPVKQAVVLKAFAEKGTAAFSEMVVKEIGKTLH